MDIYDRLKVNKIVNLRGASSRYGGSLISKKTREGYNEGASFNIDILELLEKASNHIARLVKVEAVCITNGAAGGMKICTAAIISQGKESIIKELPDVKNSKNEIIVQKATTQNYIYQGMKSAGAKLVEVGNGDVMTLEEISKAITSRTVAVQLFYGSPFQPSISEVKEMIGEKCISIMVDAASEIPPLINFSLPIKEGADFLVISGGKGLRGPQNTGLIIGSKKMMNFCSKNSSPHISIGRTLKIGKEDICALVCAVEELTSLKEEELFKRIKIFAQYAYKYLENLDFLELELKSPNSRTRPNIIRLYLKIRNKKGFEKINLVDLLLANHPKVIIGKQDDTYYLDFLLATKADLKTGLKKIKQTIKSLNILES